MASEMMSTNVVHQQINVGVTRVIAIQIVNVVVTSSVAQIIANPLSQPMLIAVQVIVNLSSIFKSKHSYMHTEKYPPILLVIVIKGSF